MYVCMYVCMYILYMLYENISYPKVSKHLSYLGLNQDSKLAREELFLKNKKEATKCVIHYNKSQPILF